MFKIRTNSATEKELFQSRKSVCSDIWWYDVKGTFYQWMFTHFVIDDSSLLVNFIISIILF